MSKIQVFDSVQPLTTYTKQDIELLSRNIISEIVESGASEKAFAFLTKLEKLVELTKKGIEGSVMDEIDKGNDNAFGVKFKVVERTNYDFKNDDTVVKLEKQIKDQKDFLKTLKEPTDIVDSDGEVKTYNPPLKSVTAYIKSDF